MNCDSDFVIEIDKLTDIALTKFLEFISSVDEVTELIQTRYPDIRAEYSPSDGGIIFIDDSNMSEYYGIRDLINRMEVNNVHTLQRNN